MQQADLMVHSRWLVPVVPHNTVLEAHSIVVRDGKIVAILPTAQCLQSYSALEIVDRPNHVLMPGLINAHTHASMTLLRGYADDLPLMQWLTEHMWPAEAKWVDTEFVRIGTQLAIAEMFRGGTTCMNEMYFFPDVAAKVSDEAGIRANIGMIAFDFPTAWAQNSDEYIEKGVLLHEAVRHYERVKTAFAPHAPYTVSDEPLVRIQTLADKLDVPIHMHIHETATEVQESVEKFGMRPLARLKALGLLTPRLSAVHLTQLKPDEIALLKECGVNAIHCPESNMKLASGTAPVSDLLATGVNVALGTDGASSNNDLDMFGEMRSAALMAKSHTADARSVSAAQALQMATLNGAIALGIDDITGSLEPGKMADMITIDLAQPATWPVFNPINQLVYAAGRDQVTDVWVQGQPVLEERQHQTLDLDSIMQEAQVLGAKILAG